MKIVTTKELKTKLCLISILVSVFSIVFIGNYVFDKFTAVDVSADNIADKTVIIDAGHGSPDGGTSSADGTLEKDINLMIAIKLRDMLESMGIRTVMTRTDDNAIYDSSAGTIREKKVSDIKNRLKIINETENSVFVSIHQNHFSSSKYKGLQVFYSPNHPESAVLADSIRLPVISYLQTDNSREIKASGSEIYLLKHSQRPSVMVECGFMSNPEETKMLKDEAYQRKLALLIAIGVRDYLINSEEI